MSTQYWCAVIWLSVDPAREQTFASNAGGGGSGAPRGVVSGGMGFRQPRALTEAEAKAFVGRYVVSGYSGDIVISSFDNPAASDRWFLLVHDRGAPPYKLMSFAPDSFVRSRHRDERVVFGRNENDVAGIELNIDGAVRRGTKR